MACEEEIREVAYRFYRERCAGSASEDWYAAEQYLAWMDRNLVSGNPVSLEDQTKYVAWQLWAANGRQDGFAEQDWMLADLVVRQSRGTGQRCGEVKTRDGRDVIITVSPGHSSYGRL